MSPLFRRTSAPVVVSSKDRQMSTALGTLVRLTGRAVGSELLGSLTPAQLRIAMACFRVAKNLASEDEFRDALGVSAARMKEMLESASPRKAVQRVPVRRLAITRKKGTEWHVPALEDTAADEEIMRELAAGELVVDDPAAVETASPGVSLIKHRYRS